MSRFSRPNDRRNSRDRSVDPLSSGLSFKRKKKKRDKLSKMRDRVDKNEDRTEKHKKHKKKHHQDLNAPRKLKFVSSPEPTQSLVDKPRTVVPEILTNTEELKNFDPKIVLFRELKDLIELAVKAKETYRDLPDGENASSVTMILRELRDYTMEIYGLTKEDRDNLLEEMQYKFLKPLFTRLIRDMTSEYDSLRTQMTMALGEKSAKDIDKLLKSSLRNFGPLLSAAHKSGLNTAKEILKSEVDVEPLLTDLNRALKPSELGKPK